MTSGPHVLENNGLDFEKFYWQCNDIRDISHISSVPYLLRE